MIGINGATYLKGCARCVAVCAVNAATLILDDEVNAVDEILRVYDGRTDVGNLRKS